MKFLNYILLIFLCIQPASNLRADTAANIAMLAGGALAVGGGALVIKLNHALEETEKTTGEFISEYSKASFFEQIFAAPVLATGAIWLNDVHSKVTVYRNTAATAAVAGLGLLAGGAARHAGII